MAILPIILVLMNSPDYHHLYRQGGKHGFGATWMLLFKLCILIIAIFMFMVISMVIFMVISMVIFMRASPSTDVSKELRLRS